MANERIGMGKTNSGRIESKLDNMATSIAGKMIKQQEVTTIEVKGAKEAAKQLNDVASAANNATKALKETNKAASETQGAKELAKARKELERQFKTASGVKRAMKFAPISKLREKAQNAAVDYMFSKNGGIKGDTLKKMQGDAWSDIHAYQAMSGIDTKSLQKYLSKDLDSEEIASLQQFLNEVPDTAKDGIKTYFDTFKNMYIVAIRDGQEKLTEALIKASADLDSKKEAGNENVNGVLKDLKLDEVFKSPKTKESIQKGLQRTDRLLSSPEELQKRQEAARQKREATLKKYIVPFDTFKEEMTKLIKEENDYYNALDKIFQSDEDVNEDTVRTKTQEALRSKAEIYKYIAGQKAQGEKNSALMENWLKTNVNEELYKQYHEGRDTGKKINYLQGYSTNRYSGLGGNLNYEKWLDTGQNPSKWINKQVQDIYDIEHFSESSDNIDKTKTTVDQMVAKMLSSIPSFENLVEAIKQARAVMAQNPEKEVGFAFQKNGNPTEIITGTKDRLSMPKLMNKDTIFTLHSHPKKNYAFPSHKGRAAGGAEGDVESWYQTMLAYSTEAVHAVMSDPSISDEISLFNLAAIPQDMRKEFVEGIHNAAVKNSQDPNYGGQLQDAMRQYIKDFGLQNVDEIFHTMKLSDFMKITPASVQDALKGGKLIPKTSSVEKPSSQKTDDISQIKAQKQAHEENKQAIKEETEAKKEQQNITSSKDNTAQIKQEQKEHIKNKQAIEEENKAKEESAKMSDAEAHKEVAEAVKEEVQVKKEQEQVSTAQNKETIDKIEREKKVREENIETIKKENQIKEEQQNIDQKKEMVNAKTKNETIQSQESKKGVETDQQIKSVLNKAAKDINANKRYYKDEILFDLQKQNKLPKEQEDRGLKGRINYYADLLSSIQSKRNQVYQQAINEAKTNNSSISDSSNFNKYVNDLAKQAMQMKAIVSQVNMLRSKLNEPDKSKQLNANEIIQRYRTPDSVKEKIKQDERIKAQVQALSTKVDEDRKEAKEQLIEVGEQRELAKQKAKMAEEEKKAKQRQAPTVKKNDEAQNIQKEIDLHKEKAEVIKEEIQAEQQINANNQKTNEVTTVQKEIDAHKEKIETIKKEKEEQPALVKKTDEVKQVQDEVKVRQDKVEAIKEEVQIKKEQQNIDQKKGIVTNTELNNKSINNPKSEIETETDQQIRDILDKTAKRINAKKQYYPDEILFDLQKQHRMPKAQESLGVKGRISYYTDLLSSIQSQRDQIYQQAINETKTNNSSIFDSSNFDKYTTDLAKQAAQIKTLVNHINALRSKLDEPDKNKELDANEIIQRYKVSDLDKEKINEARQSSQRVQELLEQTEIQQNSSSNQVIKNVESVTNVLKEEAKQAEETKKANENAFKPLTKEQLKSQLDEKALGRLLPDNLNALDQTFGIVKGKGRKESIIKAFQGPNGIDQSASLSLDRALSAYNAQQEKDYETIAEAYIRYRQIQNHYSKQLDRLNGQPESTKNEQAIIDAKLKAKQRREQQQKGEFSSKQSQSPQQNVQNEIANQQQVSNAASNSAQQQVEANKKVIASEKEKQAVQKDSANTAKTSVQEVKNSIAKELKAIAQRDSKLKKTDPEAFNKLTDVKKQQKENYLEQLKALESDNNRDSLMALSLNLKQAMAAREEAYKMIAKNYSGYNDKNAYNWEPATNIIQGHNSLINTISTRINDLNAKTHPNAQFLTPNQILQRYEEIRKSGIKKDRKDVEVDLLSSKNFVEYKNNIVLDSPDIHNQNAKALEAEATAREHNQQAAQKEGQAITDNKKQMQSKPSPSNSEIAPKDIMGPFKSLTREEILKQLDSMKSLSDEEILKKYNIPKTKTAKTRRAKLQGALSKINRWESVDEEIDKLIADSMGTEEPAFWKADPSVLMERLQAIKDQAVITQRLQDWLKEYPTEDIKTKESDTKRKVAKPNTKTPSQDQASSVAIKNAETIRQEEQAHLANKEAIAQENAEKQKAKNTISKDESAKISKEAEAYNEKAEAIAKENEEKNKRQKAVLVSPEASVGMGDLAERFTPADARAAYQALHTQNIQQEAQAQQELKTATEQATQAMEQQEQQTKKAIVKNKSLTKDQKQAIKKAKQDGIAIKQREKLTDDASQVTYQTMPHQTAKVQYAKNKDGKVEPTDVSFNTDFKGLATDLQKVDAEILKIQASFERMTSAERVVAEKEKSPILQALEKRKQQLEAELKLYAESSEYAAPEVRKIDQQRRQASTDLQNKLNAEKAIADYEKVMAIIDKAQTKIDSFGTEARTSVWTQAVAQAQNTMRVLEENQGKPDLVEQYNAQLQDQLKLLGQIQNETLIYNKNGYLLDQGQIKNAADMTAQMDKYAEAMQLGSLASEKFSADNTKVTRTYKTTSGQITQLTGQVEKLSNAWRMSSSVSQGSNAFMTGFSKSIGGVIRQLPMLIMGYSAIMKVRSEMTAGMNTFKEYDSTLTNISYTMNMTSKELDALGKSAVDMAKDLSMSVSNAEGVYKIYANMNTTAEEIQKLAKPTVILSNLSGVDASTAADEVQGIIQQFDMLKDAESDAADVSMHVVDVLNDISANVAMDYSFN